MIKGTPASVCCRRESQAPSHTSASQFMFTPQLRLLTVHIHLSPSILSHHTMSSVSAPPSPSSGEPQPATVAISHLLSGSSTEHEVFSTVETYAQLLGLSHTVPQAAVVLVRVRKHRSDHHSSVSLEEAYQYKRGRALGTIGRPPRPRGVPRQARIAPQQRQQQQQEQQHIPSTSPSSHPESVQDGAAPSLASTTAAASDRLDEFSARFAEQESEISTLRAQLQRAVRLAEQASTAVALLRQELQQRDEARTSAGTSRKRKQSGSTADIDAASLLDQLFTAEQAHQHVDHCFVSWRIEENDVTVGWASMQSSLFSITAYNRPTTHTSASCPAIPAWRSKAAMTRSMSAAWAST